MELDCVFFSLGGDGQDQDMEPLTQEQLRFLAAKCKPCPNCTVWYTDVKTMMKEMEMDSDSNKGKRGVCTCQDVVVEDSCVQQTGILTQVDLERVVLEMAKGKRQDHKISKYKLSFATNFPEESSDEEFNLSCLTQFSSLSRLIIETDTSNSWVLPPRVRIPGPALQKLQSITCRDWVSLRFFDPPFEGATANPKSWEPPDDLDEENSICDQIWLDRQLDLAKEQAGSFLETLTLNFKMSKTQEVCEFNLTHLTTRFQRIDELIFFVTGRGLLNFLVSNIDLIRGVIGMINIDSESGGVVQISLCDDA